MNLNDSKKKTTVAGVPPSAQAYFIAQLLKKSGPLERSVVCLLESEEDAYLFAATLKIFVPTLSPFVFPEWDCLPYDKTSPSSKVMGQRLCVLSSLLMNTHHLILTTAKAISQFLPPKACLSHRFFNALSTEKAIRQPLLHYLSQNGYHHLDTVRQVGDYAVRGGLIDLYPANEPNPLRLDFFDDDIDSLKSFSVETQLSLESRDSFQLSPISEVILTEKTIEQFRQSYRELFGTRLQENPLYQSITKGIPFQGMEHWLPLFYEKPQTFFDYLDRPLFIFNARAWDGLDGFTEKVNSYYAFRQESLKLNQDLYNPLEPSTFYLSEHTLKKGISSFDQIELTAFSPKGAEDFGARVFPFLRLKHENSREVYNLLKKHVAEASKKVVFAAVTPGSLEVMKTALQSLKIPLTVRAWSEIEQQKDLSPSLLVLPLSRGFETSTFQVITEEDIYGVRLSKKPQNTEKLKKKNLLEIAQFQEGDFLVHEEYGIGAYGGLVTLSIQKAQHDCVCLMYADGDKLYVPVENLNVLSFYANKFSATSMDRLGSTAWQVRKARTQEKIKEMAEKLAKIAAQRYIIEAQSYFPPDTFEEFSNLFPYPETDDQLRTIQEVLEDLSKNTPMDRLVCGDVGFGKTEIALRAAFVVGSRKAQVAILAPTTILARQHFETFQHRFRGSSLKIALISRFQSPAETKKIRDALAEGDIDIIIGTHSLLSSSTHFKNLGLLIIDEEQHFGVTQKEKIKSLYPEAHILALSATPIPRTLQMAMSGIRDLSLITTPPIERLPVHTWVMAYDDLIIKEALIREQQRGGQSFFVCPRISDIGPALRNLSKLLPNFKLAVAHGGLAPKDLEQVMIDFCDRRYDVLIATNIIESGLDIPSANTLIVYRSDLFGLAQTYQLRGRVGRSKKQGYAYFTFTQDKQLTQTAERRLEVLQSLRSLGASFQVASYDMDIRGSGNILGEEQSGQIENVGVGLYHHMLEDALAELKSSTDKSAPLETHWAPQINLGVEVLIPPSYIPDDGLRLSLYQRISGLATKEETESFQAEMIDRFGPLPRETENLIHIVSLRNLCKDLNIHKLESGPHGVLITFYKNTFADPEKIVRFIQKSCGTIKVRPDQKLVILKVWKSATHLIKGISGLLTELRES
ncbi:MAG: transcription-repair coupling factor [Alphaproteobacteria bacterium RIFCSPLOWO2_01_FULL_45_8]|nr:MAG: transcription-repair coupling factor [Alphaproteobacteria bacterium RIFCSPLOWO2_01_FULL_45_8]